MQREKLIYVDDYEFVNGNKCIIKYESIDDNTLASINNGKFLDVESIEVSVGVISPRDLEKWNNTFVYFEKFDLAQNGFANAKKGGNKTYARKLNNILRSLNEDLSKYISRSIENRSLSKIDLNRKWFYCVINVGRGESNLVITPCGRLYLFDGGDSNQGVGNKISTIIRYINGSYNLSIIDEISGFFISHPDNDHFRGVIDVIDSHTLSDDCFIYYNHHAYYPKPNWITALNRINNALHNNRLSYVVNIPARKYLSDLSSLLPSLYLKTTWPYDIYRKISKSNRFNVNDSSHCIYIGRNRFSLSFNLFGDIEKKGWERNGDIPYSELNNKFIFKPSHHGRRTGDPEVYFSRLLPVNRYVSFELRLAGISPSYVSSANNNVGNEYSELAQRAILSTSTPNALIYVFDNNGRVTMVKT